MADVTGPISSLPGSLHGSPEGTMCDGHPDRPAVRRVQGETDSFGSEMHDLCAECFAEHQSHKSDFRRGPCDWCLREADDLRPRRDFDEGMYGRVYNVCGTCIEAEYARLDEERESCGYYDDY